MREVSVTIKDTRVCLEAELIIKSVSGNGLISLSSVMRVIVLAVVVRSASECYLLAGEQQQQVLIIALSQHDSTNIFCSCTLKLETCWDEQVVDGGQSMGERGLNFK